jgi:hypothetical protein
MYQAWARELPAANRSDDFCGGDEALTPTIRVAIDEIVRSKMLQTFVDG